MRAASLRAASLLLGVALGAADVAAAEMNPRFEPLRPLLGKTWRSVFPESTPARPVVDVSRFELALNGQAVRSLHSINDGDYGGETLIVWDQAKQGLVYHYFTTAGFYTVGTMRVEAGAIVSHEIVTGNADGVTEVKATSRVLPDGRLSVKTQMLKNGQWIEGRERVYAEDAKAVVRFKD
jgi:hypothetical protein